MLSKPLAMKFIGLAFFKFDKNQKAWHKVPHPLSHVPKGDEDRVLMLERSDQMTEKDKVFVKVFEMMLSSV